jgi:hypothetical protein
VKRLPAAVLAVTALLAVAPVQGRQGTPPILPPFPTAAYPPGAPADCPDGNPRCLDQAVAEMYRRLNAVVPVCDHRAVFALAYLRVTENLRDRARSGAYEDPVWLARIDVIFAHMYFQAYDDWAAGRIGQVPAAWRLGFQAAQRRAITGLGDFIVEFNAHVNRDLAFAVAAAGLTRPDGTSHRADFDRVNDTIAQLDAQVLREITERFDPTADDVAVGPIPEAAPVLFKKWRANAWHNAERLVAAQTPEERADVAASIEQEAEAAGRSILAGTRYRKASRRVARDRWCARHGGQRPDAYRPGAARLRLRHGTLSADRRAGAVVRIACPAPSLGCRGTVAIARDRHVIGREPYVIASGRQAPVRVALHGWDGRALNVVVRLTRAGVRRAPPVVTTPALLRAS